MARPLLRLVKLIMCIMGLKNAEENLFTNKTAVQKSKSEGIIVKQFWTFALVRFAEIFVMYFTLFIFV